MKTVIVYFTIILLLVIQSTISGQPVVDFTLPDSSCVGAQINITNLTTGGSTFYWNFCSGNTTSDPTGVNIGNAGGLLNVPTYMTLVQDGNDCYSFVSCQFAGIIRYYHGTSFNHDPISWTNLGTFGLLSDHIEGIQVKKDNGLWYGFVCNNNTIVRLDFGTSPANTPTAIDIGPFPGFDMAHGMEIIKEGNTWLGFVTCSAAVTISRLNFGTSLTNIPTVQSFGSLGVLYSPGPICIVEENSLWYMMVTAGLQTLARITFGTSLLNTPTGENLGNPGGFNTQIGLAILRDCESTGGYFVNYLINGQLGKLTFTGGITGIVTGQILGNIGNLNRPHCFSEIFRQNDTLFTYITDRGSNTLTRLTFPPCTNSSVPSSTLFNPPPFSYNSPGIYNVRLLVNEGLPDQVSLCKTIVIGPVPTVDLGPDRNICPGTTTTLDAGAGFTTYLWSTGATTRTITVSAAGTYSVTITKTGCTASDAVNVSLYTVTPVNLGLDTTVCEGQTVIFDAGACAGCTYLWIDLGSGLTVGISQTFTTGLAGIYMVTVTNASGCQVMDSVQLLTITTPVVTNFPMATSICSGNSTNIILTSNVPNTTFSWTATGSSGFVAGYAPGTGNTINQVLTNSNTVNETVTYFITQAFENCVGNTVAYIVTVIPISTVNVSIVASSNNICAGNTVTFTATPTNGGITPSYQWKVNGINAGTGLPVYSYVPMNGDLVTCVLTSSETLCTANNPAISNTATMIVNPVIAVSISITPSANPVCAGSSVTFTSTPQNEGTAPAYQWQVNGINAGTNNPVFIYSPVNNDQVTCILNSSETICVTNNPATSNPVIMTVGANLSVSVSIAASVNPVCAGIAITFTAIPANGGSSPSYQWKVNGSNVGTDNPEYTYTPSNNDLISCLLTSNIICTNGNPAISNTIIMSINSNPFVTFTPCFDTVTTFNAKPFKLKGGIPLSGTYSGPGVNSLTGVFTPSLAGTGTHTITYTYTNAALCSALAYANIINYPFSVVNCGSPITDIRDNKVYPTVQIGTQCWMAANLNFGSQIAGSSAQRDNCIVEKYCYNDIPLNCTTGSVFYQWDELMQYDLSVSDKGLCPPGWHVPAENDWNTLFANWINNGFAGSPLKYSGYSGFNALLAGTRLFNISWNYEGFATFFWSSTAYTSTKAWAHAMNDYNPSVALYPASTANAYSVRCIKD